jgi:hypothetical protein
MEANDVGEEGTSDGGRRVGVAERDGVSILGKVVDHCKDDTLAMLLGEAFNEVQGNIRPNL